MEKTLYNTTTSQAQENVKDLSTWGDPNTFRLLSKAFTHAEGWMKSTKAMEIEGVGCVVQVTTQQGSNIAEAVTFVPGVKIHEEVDDDGNIVSRKLIASQDKLDKFVNEFKSIIGTIMLGNSGTSEEAQMN